MYFLCGMMWSVPPKFCWKISIWLFCRGSCLCFTKKPSPPKKKKKTSEIPGHGIIAPNKKNKTENTWSAASNNFCCSYCWWKRCCTTWDVWNPVNNGINWLAGFLVCCPFPLLKQRVHPSSPDGFGVTTFQGWRVSSFWSTVAGGWGLGWTSTLTSG